MAKKQKGAEKTKNSNGANVGYEAELWKWLTPCAAAWMRRGTSTLSSASYSFKYISDAFEEQHAKLEAEKKPAPTRKTRTNTARLIFFGCRPKRVGYTSRPRPNRPPSANSWTTPWPASSAITPRC